jgi:hypothetical protein
MLKSLWRTHSCVRVHNRVNALDPTNRQRVKNSDSRADILAWVLRMLPCGIGLRWKIFARVRGGYCVP